MQTLGHSCKARFATRQHHNNLSARYVSQQLSQRGTLQPALVPRATKSKDDNCGMLQARQQGFVCFSVMGNALKFRVVGNALKQSSTTQNMSYDLMYNIGCDLQALELFLWRCWAVAALRRMMMFDDVDV